MSSKVFVPWSGPLCQTRFLERPNRFLVRCRSEQTGEILEAHLPDPGRLSDILLPGRSVWVTPAKRPERKTKWTAVLGETENGLLVSMDATLPNPLAEKALASQVLEEFAGWKLARKEYKHGSSRWDFLLENEQGKRLLLEIKSVTLVHDGLGLFPDAVTERGARHVRELAEFVKKDGLEAAVLFMVQREDAHSVRAAEEIDPRFAEALKWAKQSGVRLYARKCIVSLEGVTLSDPVPVVF